MNGLLAYDYDSPSDSEAGPSTTNGHRTPSSHTNDKSAKIGSRSTADARRIPKSQVIIKKPSIVHKNLRTHTADQLVANELPTVEETTDDGRVMETSAERKPSPSAEPQDELSRLRKLLLPEPIPGVVDWGIPPECNAPCDPALLTKLTQFATLKHDPVNPKHFNDSLMSNRSFRNPHLYTKLVEFMDVDERTTNFPKDMWDPQDVKPDWFADQIGCNSWVRQFKADAQKEKSEKQASAQAAGKRSHINFSSAKDTAPPRKSRFQPYGSSASTRDTGVRQKTRWGP